VGAVLYTDLTGKPVFDCKSQFDTMLAHVNTPANAPSKINPEVPPELDTIVLRALAKEPSDRWQSAKEFQDAVEIMRSVVPGGDRRKEAPPLPAPADRLKGILPPLVSEPAAVFARTPARHRRSPELIALAVFTFLIVAFAFFSILKISRL